MFVLIKKGKQLDLPPDLMLDLFDNTVIPVLLYGCELWGFQTLYLIEKLQLKFYKFLFKLRPSTPSQMIYGETGKFPVSIVIKTRLLMYWYKLVCPDNCNKLSSIVYNIMYNLNLSGRHTSSYISFVRTTLIELGLPGVWDNQNTIHLDKTWFKNYIKTTLQNQFIQTWQNTLDNSSMYTIYRMLKPTFSQSSYMRILSNNCAIPITRFFTTNNNLPVNIQRYINIERRDRICPKCEIIDVGDEFHYLFICPFFTRERHDLIPKKFRKRPNALTFQQLMNCDDKITLLKLKHFVGLINKGLE